MAILRVGIVGAGWPGGAHARGYTAAGGFKIVAVADLIPSRRGKFVAEFPGAKEFADARELIAEKDIDAVSVCLPNHLHAPITLAVLKAGKHVICEKPTALNAREAKKIEAAAHKSGKIVMYAMQRRFGGAEQAARQAVEKSYAGEVYHARAVWMRTRGIPQGTGWFTDKSKSGGGALIDLGVHMLDLAWSLMGQPKPVGAYGVTHKRFGEASGVEDAAFAIVRFENGKSLELATSWAINQPPQGQGTICRLYGDKAAIDVYTNQGAVLYRNFDEKGEARLTPLKQPKMVSHAAMMRHFRDCILGKAKPLVGPREGVEIMRMVDAIYRSSESGKSVEIKA